MLCNADSIILLGYLIELCLAYVKFVANRKRIQFFRKMIGYVFINLNRQFLFVQEVPDSNKKMVAKISMVIDEYIEEYHLDASALLEGVFDCIREMAQQYGDIGGIGVTSFGEAFVCRRPSLSGHALYRSKGSRRMPRIGRADGGERHCQYYRVAATGKWQRCDKRSRDCT